MRDPNGQPYSMRDYCLQQTGDGNVALMRRSTQTSGHYALTRLDSSRNSNNKNEQQQQQHHPHHHHHNHHHPHHQEHKE